MVIRDMVAVMEQKNPPMEEHHRFLPLMDYNIYNCESCGVRVALLQIVSSTSNDQEQFKVCGTCLKEYIDQAAKK
jgi:hydrogenase maturation factor HypF (carbamoyltransferase family)